MTAFLLRRGGRPTKLVQVKGNDPKMPEGTGLQPAHDPYVSIPTMLSLGIIPARAEHKDRNIPEREFGASGGNRTHTISLEDCNATVEHYARKYSNC